MDIGDGVSKETVLNVLKFFEKHKDNLKINQSPHSPEEISIVLDGYAAVLIMPEDELVPPDLVRFLSMRFDIPILLFIYPEALNKYYN